MLSGLKHEVRSQWGTKNTKVILFWMTGWSLTQKKKNKTNKHIFCKSDCVFYWWHLHIHICEVKNLVSIWFFVSFANVRKAICCSALAALAENPAWFDSSVPSHTWKTLRWIPDKTELMFLLPVLSSEQAGKNANGARSAGHGLFCLSWTQGFCWTLLIPAGLWQGWANEILNWFCEELSPLPQVDCCKSCF